MLFAAQILRSFLQRKQIATLQELKEALGTISTMTVFRKLKTLGYRTSYSDRGKYYTLADIPRFDAQGLWSCRNVWFSREGNLLATAQKFVEQSPAGFTASELQAVLNVEVKQSLLDLAERRRLERRPMEGVYVYFAREAGGSGSNVCSGRLARPSGRWRSPPWGPGRRNSKLPSFCFTACWMSSSGVCMPD